MERCINWLDGIYGWMVGQMNGIHESMDGYIDWMVDGWMSTYIFWNLTEKFLS